MFRELERINQRPAPFEFYTAADLWTDAHTSERMLACHLDPGIDVSSRNHAFIDQSVDWIASRFGLRDGTRIADFGCGPGLYCARLARLGAEVTGIDFSSRSIAYARGVAAAEGLAIDYLNEDYLAYETDDRFDLAIMIMCDFCALSPEQRRRILAKFHRLLLPGGAVLLDVYSLAAFDRRQESASYEANLLEGFWAPGRYYGFLNTFKYEREKVVLDKYTLVESDRTRVVYNWLQYFDPDRLQSDLESAGFSVESFFADVAGSPFDEAASEFAVIGRKARES